MLIERLALNARDLLLKLTWLPASVRTRESTSSPWRSTVYFGQVRQLAENRRVPQRNEDDAVVSERRESIEDGGLLSTTRGGSAHEEGSILLVERTLGPEPTGGIPERLFVIGFRSLFVIDRNVPEIDTSVSCFIFVFLRHRRHVQRTWRGKFGTAKKVAENPRIACMWPNCEFQFQGIPLSCHFGWG